MATNHRVPLKSGETDLLPECLPLLPTKDRDKIEESNDAEDFLGKKTKLRPNIIQK